MSSTNPVVGMSTQQQAALLLTLLSKMRKGELTVQRGTEAPLSDTELVQMLQADPAVTVMHGHRHLPLIAVDMGPLNKPKPPVNGELPEVPLDVFKFFMPIEMDKRFLDNPLLYRYVTVTMKLPAECSGWAVRMGKLGYKVSSRSEKFGRQEHVIKKDGAHLVLLQGGSAVVKNKLDSLSPEKMQILGDLRSVGALAD